MPINDKVKKLYDALKADGGEVGSEQEFNDWFFKPGDEGYKNRMYVYDTFKADGADVGKNYEEFRDWLGLVAREDAAKTDAPTSSAPANDIRTTQAAQKTSAKEKPWAPSAVEMTNMQQSVAGTLGRAKESEKKIGNANRYLKKGALSGGQPISGGMAFNPATGKIEQTYLTPLGDRTFNKTIADEKTRQYRLTQAFNDRMKENGLDAKNPEDVKKQAQLDWEAPMRNVLDSVWKQAEEADRAADEEYRKALRNGTSPVHAMGPDGMPLPTSSDISRDLNRAVKRKETFNLENLSEKIYDGLPDDYRSRALESYTKYFNEHPDELKGRNVKQAAEDALKAEVYNAVYQKAVQVQMPKSKTEFLLRKIADQPLISPTIANDIAASYLTNSFGMNIAEQDAMSQYGQKHKTLDIIGTVGNMAFDPATHISLGFGSVVGKGAVKLGGKALLKGATKEVAGRYAAGTLTGRIIGGVAGGAANFGTFETIKSIESQMRLGGVVNPETGKPEGFSWGDVLQSTGRGLLLGGATGMFSPILGNVGDKVVKATASTAGKMAVRGGEVALSTLAEGTVFSIPEWINGERDAFDVWSDNMAMMIGFKVSHGIKSAPRVINGLRPIKPTDGRPLTPEERNHNRMNFAERVRKTLDGNPDLSLTAEERDELRKYGYGDLSDLFTKKKIEDRSDRVDGSDGQVEVYAEPIKAESVHPEFDGYDAMERLMQDGRVSEAARAKAYYILTGRMLPMSTVVGVNEISDDNGNIIIQSISAQGGVVTSRKFRAGKAAQEEASGIIRQAELNTIGVGERYKEAVADDMVLNSAIEEIFPGADPNTVKKIYHDVKSGSENVGEAQHEMAEKLDVAIERNKYVGDDHRPQAIREQLKEETGVDVDGAIRKSPKDRTEQETEAVREYAKRLFPEQEETAREPEPTQEQSEAQNIYDEAKLLYSSLQEGDPSAQADIDAIALRMKEAHQEIENVFGTEAEQYLYQLGEDPWALIGDPTLTEEQQDAVLYYINSKAALDGVMDASNEAAERKRDEIRQTVEKRTNKESGLIVPATMKVDDRPVYIVKGNVVMFPDKSSVDVRNSSESIVLCDEATGEYEFASPEQIYNVGEPIDPQTELSAAEQVIEQEQKAVFGIAEESDDMPQEHNSYLGSVLNEQEATEFIVRMEERAEVAPDIDLTIENWDRLFGDNGKVETPIGQVKMGENQFMKMMREGRNGKLGMVKPTLENPDVIIEDESEAKQGDTAERGTSYIFIKSFKKEDGSRYYYFTSVTVSKDGKEVVVSNHEKRRNAIAKLLSKGKLVWKHADNVSDASDVAQGLYSSQGNVSDLATEGTDAPQTNQRQAEREGGQFLILSPDDGSAAAYSALPHGLSSSGKDIVLPEEKQIISKEIPVRKNGNRTEVLYHKVPVSRTLEDLYDGAFSQQEVDDFVAANIEESTKQVDKIAKQAPAVSTNKAEYLEKRNKWREQLAEAEERRDYWQQVNDEMKRITMRNNENVDVEDNSSWTDMEPRDGVEFASTFFGGKDGLRITPESFRKETGFSKEEQKTMLGIVASKENGGVSIERAAEIIMENGGDQFFEDSMNARNAIIEMLGDGNPRGYIARKREDEKKKEKRAIRETEEQFYIDAYGMSPEDYNAYEEQFIPSIIERYAGLDVDAYYSGIYNELKQIENERGKEHDTVGESQDDGRSSEILSQEQTDEAGGVEQREERGGSIEGRGESYGQNAEVFGEASVREQTPNTVQRNAEHQPITEAPKENAGLTPEETAATIGSMISAAEENVNTSPTEAQKEAGNYKKGHVRIGQFDITIENPKGSVRSGHDANGKEWSVTMNHTYGYIRGTQGVDGDHIDVYASSDIDGWDGRKVFVVDQYNPDGTFDEHKVMLGFNDRDEAYNAYLSNYEKDWKKGRRIEISTTNIDEFEKWIDSSKRKTKPFSEYKGVKIEENKSDNTKKKVIWSLPTVENGSSATSVGVARSSDTGGVESEQSGNSPQTPSSGKSNTISENGNTLSEETNSTGEELSNGENVIQGLENYSREEIKRIARYYIEEALSNAEIEAKVIDLDIHGSRNRGTANESSDLDVVVEYSGDIREDSLFNILNDEENPLSIDGIKVDINPIRKEETGDLGSYMERSRQYDAENTVSPSEKQERVADVEPYTITPTTYTNKKGKTSDIHLVKFNRELSKEEQAALKAFIAQPLSVGKKTSKGWYDRKEKGYMMRSEEAAKELAGMIGNDEAVADAQPLTAGDYREAVSPSEEKSEVSAKPKKSPVNRVSIEELFNDINKTGDTNFTDNSEPVVPAKEETAKAEHEVSDDEMRSLLGDIRDILGIGEDEAGIKFRDPDGLGKEQRMKLQAAGMRLAMGLVERGAVNFEDYSKQMVGLLGDKIRPWLKAFYGGLRYVPGFETYEFTPYEDVERFDVENFDKTAPNPIADAEMRVEERKAANISEKANQEIKETRNEKRKKDEQQTAADTTAIAEKAGIVASKAEAVAETSADEQEINRAIEQVDETLEKVNEQLALLGFYEFDEDDSKFHESYGYMLTAEKKALKDATDLAKQIVDDLGIDIDKVASTPTLSKSKKRTAVSANIAPAGGDITIRLPLNEGRELAVYIGLNPVAERGTLKRGDNLAIERILYRIENPNGSGWEKYGHNMYAPTDVTYADFLNRIKQVGKGYIPEQASKDNETVNGYKRGDEVMYDRYGTGKWEKQRIVDFDNGQPVFDSFGTNVISEIGNWSNIKPVEKKEDIFAEAERIAKEAQEKKRSITQKNATEAILDIANPGVDKKGNKKPKQEQRIADMFSDLFSEQSINNEKKTDIQPRTGTAERAGGHEPRQNESLGESKRNEDERTDGRGMGGRSVRNPLSDEERSRGVSVESSQQHLVNERKPLKRLEESERKNTHNNHAERGTDYAPKGEDARIKANIEAIALAKQLIASGADATPEQMAVLRKFSGWGGLGKAFSNHEYALRLQNLLGAEGMEDAMLSRNSAYYTPAEVIDTLWDIAQALGFEGGNVLEGSAGIGNILGLMPSELSDRSTIHAVEKDSTTGGILSLLYPDAEVDVQGFEETKIPNNSVDLAITNVPFVTGLRVFDKTGDKDLAQKFRDIHDFCIAKNIRKLREGGIGIFITSNGTMDNSASLRRWITNEGNADVVGAFRMHNETFGGAPVTSDIIVVRKRVNGKHSPNAIDIAEVIGTRTAEYNTGETRKVKGKEVPVTKTLSMTYNKYFAEHPENMAGEMLFAFERGETFRPESRGLFPIKDKPQNELLKKWVERMREMKPEEQAERAEDIVTRINERLGEGVKEGSMVLNSDGELCIARMGEAVPLDLNANKVKGKTKAQCFEDYTAIKKALTDVLEYQSTHDDNAGLEPLLKQLNNAFDTFTRTYGNLHKNTAISFLRNDVDFSSIQALETYTEKADKKGNKVVEVGKTDIFRHRVIDTEKEPQPATIKDGILASLYKSGEVDTEYIAEALGKSVDDVKREIVESGLGFENPASGLMEVSYRYLSGNVREKLAIAKDNNVDGKYDANIKALENAIPMTIPSHLIEFTLGSSWIEPKLYEDFVFEKTGLRVKLSNVSGTWYMDKPYYTFNEKNRAMAVESTICDKTILGHELIEAALTNRQITVSKTVKHYDGSTETITDKTATAQCGAKVDEIRAEFKDWARDMMQKDADMSASIEETYNEQFNNYVPMTIPEEFVPKHFGGQVSELHGSPFALRPHQGKAVVRGTTEPVLLAHEVGTGKTYTLITTAMEMRRLGTAKKPMIVVQNATVGQFVESAKGIYPNAKILTIEDADRTAEGRKNFYAKIKYNDWDMIVVPQSVFERIPDSEEREMAYIQDIIEEKMKVLEDMREADANGKSMITRQAEKDIETQQARLAELTEAMEAKRKAKEKDSRWQELKQIERDVLQNERELYRERKNRDEKREAKTRENAEVRALEMLDREVDDVENFDDMGIDALLVDEAHEYKHLGFATAMQRGVKGVDPSYSKKSQGVFLKSQAVMQKNNGRNVVFATGTPISNTAAEIWTFMRYLMPADTMKSYGIYYFDDFVRNFGNISQMVEFATNGKFKENNRFAGYVNLPELVRIWSSVADTVLTREAGGVSDKIPEMEGEKATDMYLPQTRALRSVMKFVKDELQRYEDMSGREKKENSHIPLTMYGIAKAAAVDARLVVDNAEDDPNSKTNATVREVLRSLADSKKYKGTVAIFADNYQNKRSGFNLYEDIRNKLISEGVPSEQIIIIKPGMTVKKKLEIFEKVNAGDIRVIMGSTFTLGTGVNIQERLHTAIHIDAPNRPMDYTQRNGRILRQGNLHKDMGIPVRIIRFGVEDSLDVTAYQRLKTKGAIADSIMNGSKMMQNSMENRVLEEEEDMFGDMTAQLSGSEYAILKNQAEREVRNLTAKQKGHDLDQVYVHNQLPKIEGFIKGAEMRIETETKNLETLGKYFPDGTFKKITIGKHTFDSVEAMEDFFKEQNAKMNDVVKQVETGGEGATSTLTVDIDGLPFVITTKVERKVTERQGSLFNEIERSVTYSCEQLGIKDMQPKGNRVKNAVQEITENIVTGVQSRGLLKRGEDQLARYTEEKNELEKRVGKEFPFKQQLEEAKARLAEYEEAMKKELAEKEAKYAELDKSVEAASNLAMPDDEEDSTDNTKYRDGDGERLREIQALEPIEVAPNDLSKTELRKIYDNLPSVDKDGREIEFYRSAFKKIYKDGGLFGQVVPVLDEILEQSVLAYSEADNQGGQVRPDGSVHKEHPNVISFDNYVGKVLLNGKEYYVRTTTQNEVNNSGTHSFMVTAVDLYENNAKGLSLPITTRARVTFDVVSDAKLQQFFERASNELLRSDMEERISELSEKLNAPVRVVTEAKDVEDLPSARHRRAKGFYDPKTGEIVVVLPNNTDVADVENTVVHEVVGHRGLRALVGAERMDDFVDEIYSHASDPIRRSIDNATNKRVNDEADRLRVRKSMERERNGEDVNANYYTDMAEARVEAEAKREQYRRDATEEYMADMAGRIGDEGFENMSREEQTLWGRIKARVQQFLDKFLRGLKIAKSIRLTDKDLAYILFKSWKNMRDGGVFAQAEDAVMRRKTGWDSYPLREVAEREMIDENNKGFNAQLVQYINGNARANEVLRLGHPMGAMRHFLHDLPIIMRPRILHKASETKHNVSLKSLKDLPCKISHPIFVFQRNNNTLGILTEIKDRDDKNVCVAVEMGRKIQNGKNYIEVNDIRSIHGRDAANIVLPIVNNNTLRYVDKEKGLAWLSSASYNYQQEIAQQDLENKEPRKQSSSELNPQAIAFETLESAAKIIKDFENPDIADEKVVYRFRDGDLSLEEYITKMKAEAASANSSNLQAKREAMRAIGGNLNHLRSAMARQREYDLTTVKSVTDLAKVLLDNNRLDDLSKYETKRILGTVGNVVGKQDVSRYVQKVMDIMVDNQLRMGSNTFGRLLSIKGSRVDARGIEVQGKLDPDGQRIAQVVKKTVTLPKGDIDNRIAEALNRMGSADQTIADEAALEYAGLQVARQYVEDIAESKVEEKELRESLKQAKEDKEAGTMTDAAYKQYVEAANEAIRQNKIERAEAYNSLVEQMSGVLGESVERAKAWRDAERRRVEEIQHNANSDMEGRPADEHHKNDRVQKLSNNSAVRFLLAPLGTFDQMLRMFGKKNVRGEGYLWNRYMRGWVDATEKEYTGYHDALEVLDDKVSEVYGRKMSWGDLFTIDRKLPTMAVRFWDGGEYKDHELTQGNLLYIYMADKMSDGRMKLRRMGITEEEIEDIKNFLDPKFVELADWIQEEFLVNKRNEYNEVHKRMFGASMAAIENYFPLKILANARLEDVDVADDTTDTALPATSTGSIIKRRRNNLALDVTDANAFSVILDHLQQMERWAAFAEFNRDLNTLLSYKRFRNQVMNMTSVYGAGKTLWNNFRNVCSMAAGAYRPPIAALDKAAVNIAKGVTAAKVSFRLFTALKQFLSMPAYASDCNPLYLAKNIVNPYGAWKWSMENLPIFEKRWKSRMAGDPRLMKTDMDWKAWRSNIVQIASRIGMSPNAFVDALTVSIGAHSMYETKLHKYIRQGYEPEAAEKRAKQDATILFNQTQQSSEGAFLSTMQVDRSWLSVLFTVFRNSSMSYTRQLYDSVRNIKRFATPGYQEKSVEFMAKQLLRNIGIKTYSERFDKELEQQIAGELPAGHIYQLGKPGGILQSAGFPDMPIELSATRLAEKATQSNHPFPLEEVKGLVDAINKPLAVFRYGNNAMNVIVGLQYQGKQFLVGVHFNQTRGGSEVSSVRGLFPKDNAEWLNWISQGKAMYLNHKKVQALIDQQRINLADVDYLDLEDVAKVIKDFENPEIPELKNDVGWNEQDLHRARQSARSEYRRSILRDLARICIFGYALQFAWNLGAYIPYLLFGEDKDEKSKMWDDVFNHTMFGSVEGLTGGDMMSSAGQMWINGNGNWSYLVKDMPLVSDASNILKKIPKDQAAAMNDVINLLVQSGVGVNPQSLTDAACAIIDACGDDADTCRECALLIARIINCPQSQIDKIYFDELGTDGKEARKMTPAEIAERYAEYKSLREAPLTEWMRPEEKTDSIKSKKERYVLNVAKEKIGKAIANDETRMLLKEYDEVSKQEKAINKLWETDREGYRNGRKELWKNTDLRRHYRVKRYKHDMRELTDKYLRTKSVDEMGSIVEQMFRTRDKMLDDIHAQQ